MLLKKTPLIIAVFNLRLTTSLAFIVGLSRLEQPKSHNVFGKRAGQASEWVKTHTRRVFHLLPLIIQ
jgi:hypothetical protein